MPHWPRGDSEIDCPGGPPPSSLQDSLPIFSVFPRLKPGANCPGPFGTRLGAGIESGPGTCCDQDNSAILQLGRETRWLVLRVGKQSILQPQSLSYASPMVLMCGHVDRKIDDRKMERICIFLSSIFLSFLLDCAETAPDSRDTPAFSVRTDPLRSPCGRAKLLPSRLLPRP